MLKIVHTADLHVGKPLSLHLDKERGYIRRREIEMSLWRIVDFVKEEKAHILLIAGDMFEHHYARPSWIQDATLLLSTIPETHVFISPGDHDPWAPDSLYHCVDWPNNVTLFPSGELSRVTLQSDGTLVDIYGFGWPKSIRPASLLKDFRVEHPERFNIMMFHEDLAWEPDYVSPQLGRANTGVDYLALGHLHTPMGKEISGTTVVYPGCPEPLEFGDEGQRGVYLVTSEVGKGDMPRVSTEFVPTALRRVKAAEIDLTGIYTHEQIRNVLLSIGTPEERMKDVWKVALTGTLGLGVDLKVASLRQELLDQFFCLQLTSAFATDHDLKPLMSQDNRSLEARFVQRLVKAKRQAEQDGDPNRAGVIDRAIYYGLDALRQGEITIKRSLN